MAQARSYDLSDKPFTQALLLEAAEAVDRAKLDIGARTGAIPQPSRKGSLKDFARSCATVTALEITSGALVSIGREPAFYPGQPVPKDAPMVIAFSLLVLSNISASLKAEGLDLDLEDDAIELAGKFFLLHSPEEKAENVVMGLETFREITQSLAKSVGGWGEYLAQLTPIYVLRNAPEKSQQPEQHFLAAFGHLLGALLSPVGQRVVQHGAAPGG